MGLQALFFYIFSGMLIGSASLVIIVRNPVYSVFFLILAFLNAAGLFLLIGAEFVAMIILVVYIGAVAVLFLFVVMMLDINFEDMRSGFAKHAFLGVFVVGMLGIELILGIKSYSFLSNKQIMPIKDFAKKTNTELIGNVLYTNYIYCFQISGFILLVSMIGAIVLTLRHRNDVRRQDISKQLARNPKNAVELVKVKFRKGIQ
ncbi:NADH-ubiquinone oxidoreductase chain J [Liberibacter crescens BT-1]|uniref:NADH-quinone oxidoreductase subunit J n=1 Tax=Liberibacter crescens (strain BT-1) TaxID=1215343 RepID=L0ERY3_LIBCB|nr:NADH-quinone oxidoreductase subunit J [Liberibacter crescens]AGA64259.1 NADH-ubiquinone oxidoreductase chain J [Liberibacter crescens BT-1]AMC12495.1 NADH:ubiquinone oxidoreductase subunit J [Liberibacter crescens]